MQTQPNPSARPKGFTLIELLVVIAIIVLLVSILMPALSRARDLSRDAVCRTNMKSVGMAFYQYAMKYKGILACQEWGTGPSGSNIYWFRRMEIVQPEISKFFRCPRGQLAETMTATTDYSTWASMDMIKRQTGRKLSDGTYIAKRMAAVQNAEGYGLAWDGPIGYGSVMYRSASGWPQKFATYREEIVRHGNQREVNVATLSGGARTVLWSSEDLDEDNIPLNPKTDELFGLPEDNDIP